MPSEKRSVIFSLTETSGFVRASRLGEVVIVTKVMIFSLAIFVPVLLSLCHNSVFVTCRLHYLFSVQLDLNNFIRLVSGSKINATNVFLNYQRSVENPLEAEPCH